MTKKIYEKVKNNLLFHGIESDDFELMLTCMSAKSAFYQRKNVILLSGDRINLIGLILSGRIQIIKEDTEGHIVILAELGPSEIFGEVFACAGVLQSPVTVLAVEDSEILLMEYRKIITVCSSACSFHAKLIENMLKLIAQKNLMLNQKNEILSRRTTREKLLSYFDLQRGTALKFTIPYNREELAHYLCVDRSAMSRELCKMRDEGLLRFRKNVFEILSDQ